MCSYVTHFLDFSQRELFHAQLYIQRAMGGQKFRSLLCCNLGLDSAMTYLKLFL